MKKVIIFGNSGSGKSTLAKSLADKHKLAHLDLDTIAWLPVMPPLRMAIEESTALIDKFLINNDSWVIEGCYADLLEYVMPKASKLFFLNLSVDDCISNAKNRAWEPHKYESKQAQDENLAMLLEWIGQYPMRSDTFSQQAHQNLYEMFEGDKTMLVANN